MPSKMQQILCGSDEQNWIKRLSLQKRNFLGGIEHRMRRHFGIDVSLFDLCCSELTCTLKVEKDF